MPSVFKRVDWQLFAALGIILGAGLLSLLSSSPELFGKQLLWVGISIIAAGVLMVIDMRSFFSHRGLVIAAYVSIVLLLIATYFLAPEIKGNRAWLVVGPFQLQPSELAKVVLILTLAYFFSKAHVGIGRWRTIIASFLYVALPAGLIMIQPDLGSALVLGAVWFGFIMVSGLPLKRLAVTLGVCALAFVFMWTSVLKDYQKERIVGMFVPEGDPLGANYSVIQSKIAIGAGGLFGKGFRQGTQVQLGFLPEAHNDFIFAAIAEEGGVVAVIGVLFGFGWMWVRLLKIGLLAEGNVYKFISLGAVILFVAQFIFHVGSNLGFLPVIGTTLPFVSYGGSSILANMILIGIIQSAYARSRG